MTPYWTDTNPDIAIYHGDCLQVMREVLADNSIDAIVTDPPAGIGFMGKEWDHHKGGRDQWVAWMSDVMRGCLRVLKPGGHALVWAIPRTSHWTAWAIESAGFEIRDRVSHLFGSGFPKSLDVGKAIDDAAGAERSEGTKGPYASRRPHPLGESIFNGAGSPVSAIVTQPVTDAAKQWNGWGTALKPACEDWWLCRKPLEGTVVENVLKYGTGGINIDACRIGSDVVGWHGDPSNGFSGGLTSTEPDGRPVSGRWPSHIIHDGSDEVLAGFPDSESRRAELTSTPGGIYGGGQGLPSHTGIYGFDDGGSTARYFYCAKASKEDREIGLDDLPVRTAGEVTDRQDGSDGLNSPRAGAGRTSGSRNVHPTVKPVELMRYLCRLIAPPKGLILDPFFGSGSTGKAARKERFRCIGIEADEYYCAIAARRCAIPQKEVFV